LSIHGGGIGTGLSSFMKQGNNSMHKTTSLENHSFFPSELLAKPRLEVLSGDSRGRDYENMIVFGGLDGGNTRDVTRPEKIVREIVLEFVLIESLTIQEFVD
jgi:hypothetical protein